METNEERLERIKNHGSYFTGFGEGVKTSVMLDAEDWGFIIGQAERAQLLEKSAEGFAKAVEIYSGVGINEAMKELIDIIESEETK